MKKFLAVFLSVLLALLCCVPAFAAEKTITDPASAYAEYDRARVAQNDAGYIASLNYDQLAGVLLDWLDRKIAEKAADFNTFTAQVGVDLQITGVDSLVGMKDHVAELGGDFANLNTEAIVTRENGDINFLFGIFQFMADNAETLGKVFRWDEEVFDYGKVGEFIESEACTDQAVKDFYHDVLVNGDIQDKFIREIAREMDYEVPETRTETFDEIISNGVKAWFLRVVGEALSEESKAAVNAMDLRTTDVYTLVKEFVGLLQNDYKDQLDGVLRGFLEALQGMVRVVKEGVNLDPPELTIGYTENNPYATYHPASTEQADYMPVIYANDQAIETLRQYQTEEIPVLANSRMTEEDKTLVAGEGEAWGKNVMVKATAAGETLVDLDVVLSDVEAAVISALEEGVNGQGASQTVTLPMLGETTVAFNISDAEATFSYKMYKDVDSFAAQVKVESATAKVNITSPIEATVTANLLDPDATEVSLTGMYAMLSDMAKPMVVAAIKTAVGDMFKDPAFATVIVNNLDGKIEELETIRTLAGYIDAEAEYDETLLDVMADYDAYKGAVGQVNHILYKLVDMILTDEGMADLGIADGKNEHLTENLQKICEKADALFSTMKKYIDRETFVALAGELNISEVFASDHGFNAGMIYDMDFSSVENTLDCGIRVACDLLAEDDPDSVFYDFHMRVEDLNTLDGIAVAAVDMLLGKVMDAVDLEDWTYAYTAIDAAAVDAGSVSAEDAIMGKLTEILYAAATYAVEKINAAANEFIGTLNEKTGLNVGAVALALGVEQSEDWRTTLGALADRFIALTDGLCIPSGTAKEQSGLWEKLTALADVLPMHSLFSNYTNLADMNEAFFDRALDGDLAGFLAYFEVKEDAIAGEVPVTFALINASDYIVDRFFPDTVQAELYADHAQMTEVQEYFTGCESDQGIAARNMVSINGRKTHLLPALLDLIREAGLLPGFACSHENVLTVPEVASTCQVKGHAAGTKCADCGAILEGCEEYDYAPHSFTVLTQTVEATCTAGGYKVYKCATCDATETRDRVDATGHTYQNGVCVFCGQSDPNYVPPEPDDGHDDGGSGNFFSDLFARIRAFFRRIADFFRKLFS